MDLYNNLKIDFEYEDEKGWLAQLVHKGYDQVNVLVSKKGSVRGNHFHKVSTEAFFIVSGSVDVSLRKDSVEQKVVFKQGDFFVIPIFTWHFMYFLEDCIMVVLYDIPVEQEGKLKDIYREGE